MSEGGRGGREKGKRGREGEGDVCMSFHSLPHAPPPPPSSPLVCIQPSPRRLERRSYRDSATSPDSQRWRLMTDPSHHSSHLTFASDVCYCFPYAVCVVPVL